MAWPVVFALGAIVAPPEAAAAYCQLEEELDRTGLSLTPVVR